MRCINADELIMADLGNGNYIVTAETMANARTFEAEPVRHGRWIDFESDKGGHIQYCSSCGVGCPERTDYCPHCGAKMVVDE